MTNSNNAKTANLLKDTITLDRKISLFIKYLMNGGEVEINGRTWVWLDNYVTREEDNGDGTVTQWGIDGLAIKGVSINSVTQEEKPHYMGQGDIPLRNFIDLVQGISEESWFQITASLTLMSMNKKRD